VNPTTAEEPEELAAPVVDEDPRETDTSCAERDVPGEASILCCMHPPVDIMGPRRNLHSASRGRTCPAALLDASAPVWSPEMFIVTIQVQSAGCARVALVIMSGRVTGGTPSSAQYETPPPLGGALVVGVVLAGLEVAGALPGDVFVVDDPQAEMPAATARLRPRPSMAAVTLRFLSRITVSSRWQRQTRCLGNRYGRDPRMDRRTTRKLAVAGGPHRRSPLHNPIPSAMSPVLR
jgi:hypothetical protein